MKSHFLSERMKTGFKGDMLGLLLTGHMRAISWNLDTQVTSSATPGSYTARDSRVGAGNGSAESAKAAGEGGSKNPENMPQRQQVSPHTQEGTHLGQKGLLRPSLHHATGVLRKSPTLCSNL